MVLRLGERLFVATPPLTWTAEEPADGVLRVAFYGQGGVGSNGNKDGARMREVISQALTKHRPRQLLIDFCAFEYTFGDWIGSVPIAAIRVVGKGNVCVLATGETATALRSLWEFSKLGQIVPLVAELREALAILSVPGG